MNDGKSEIREVIGQIANDDPERQKAIATLYKNCYPRFTVFISHQLRKKGISNGDTTADIFEDAFRALLKKIICRIEPSKFEPFNYMGGVVRNIIADILKGKYNHPVITTDDLDDFHFKTSDDSWNALDEMEEDENKEKLNKCLEKLKTEFPHGWEIIKLRYYKGMRLIEISQYFRENEKN
jgi:RNA polymerase sigma factor (sigma-70 family)